MNQLPFESLEENLLPEYPHYHISKTGELFFVRGGKYTPRKWTQVKGYFPKGCGRSYNMPSKNSYGDRVNALELMCMAYLRRLNFNESAILIDGNPKNLTLKNISIQEFPLEDRLPLNKISENIPDFKGYHVTHNGRVFCEERRFWQKKAYYNFGSNINYYKLFKDKTEFSFSAPQLVMMAYKNQYDDEKDILFKDGNEKNLNPDNLYQPQNKNEFLIKRPLDNFNENLSSYPGYHISPKGELFSRKNLGGRTELEPFWRKCSPFTSPSGYIKYSIANKNNKQCTKGAHQLVAEAFVFKASDNLIVCHNDGNKLNNEVSNLRWDTHQSNTMDRAKHGTMFYGEDSSLGKYSNEYILKVLQNFVESDQTLTQFAENLDISHQGLRHIINQETRSETNIPQSLIEKARYKASHSGKKITPDKIIQIFADKKEGLSMKEISRKFNLHYQNIYLILKRKIWKNVVIPDELIP
jgi:hypothetical protein